MKVACGYRNHIMAVVNNPEGFQCSFSLFQMESYLISLIEDFICLQASNYSKRKQRLLRIRAVL